MKKKNTDNIILVDIDDTIWQLLNSWIPWLCKLYGLNIKPRDIKNWNMCESLPMLTEKEIFAPFNYKEFWHEIKPIPGANKYLKKLIKDGYDIYLVSSSHSKDVSNKMRAVKDMFSFIDDKHIIICNNKQLVRGKYLIDDAPHNLEGGDYKPILFTANHNKWYKNTKIPRCNSWKEVYDIISKNS